MREDNLSEFFSIIGEAKKRQREKTEEIVSSSFEDFFWKPLQEEVVPKKVKKIKPTIDKIKKKKKIETNLVNESVNLEESNFTEPPIIKNKDPLTPLNQNYATLEDLNKKFNLFTSRLQQQLSTLGGGGETRFEFLDDVDRDSVLTDNYFVKYDASLKKFIGDPADGVGITSIVSVTGVTTFYQANPDDDYIGVNTNVPLTIVLPSDPLLGKKIIIKDEGNKVNQYRVEIKAGIGKSVENDSSVIMNVNHHSLTFFYTGQNWYIV